MHWSLNRQDLTGSPPSRKGRVAAVVERDDAQVITVRFDDGTEAILEAPNEVLIEKGFPVSQTDVGDGKPIYVWG